nr:PTS sugar transporter subunit IIB [Tetragenococcus halophilus]
MLLFASPFSVEQLVNSGYEIPKLNVGGMRGNEQRKKLTKAVALTEEEKESFKRLLAKDIDIEIQMVPSESIIKMKEVL